MHLASGEVEALGESAYGAFVGAWSPDHTRAILADGYTVGDTVLYEPDGDGGRRVLYGTLLDERVEGGEYPPHGVRSPHYVESGNGLLLVWSLVEDTGSRRLPRLRAAGRDRAGRRRRASGTRVVGELEGLTHLDGRSLRAPLQHRRLLLGVRSPVRRAGAGA